MTNPAPPEHLDPDPDSPSFHYDEFSFFAENCAEYELTPAHRPAVECHPLDGGRELSALRWGRGEIRAVFLHQSVGPRLDLVTHMYVRDHQKAHRSTEDG